MTSQSPQRPDIRPISKRGTMSTTSETKQMRYTPRSTADDYIRMIAYHSQQTSAETLYPGEIYNPLREFFGQKTYKVDHVAGNFAGIISPSHADQLTSPDKQSLPAKSSDSSRSQEIFNEYADPESCMEALKSNIEKSQPQVLFLRGHPSPHWLASIGAFCQADPELFRWFLRYREDPESESDDYFGCAPSIMSNIFRFKFFTIGTRKYRHHSPQEEVDTLRKNADRDFQKYQTELRKPWVLKPGDSIVRQFYVLDARHCIIEQEIVVSVFDIGKTWIAIACTDAGHDLRRGPLIPWLGGGDEPFPITLLPIIQYKPRCALKSRSIRGSTTGSERENKQSLAVFPEGYGHGLDWSLAKTDRFHVLSDMFRLAAFSQKQFLNVLKEKIAIETSRSSLSNENPTLANLLYFRDILQDQLSNASYMLQLMDNRTEIFQNVRRSSVVSSADQISADRSVAEINILLKDQNSQAQLLHERCTQGMAVMSNNSMLAESKRSVHQAKLVTKLTLVAFVYLPFTFTAGFFGMNFAELGADNSMHLWIFFAASLPLMFVTLAFLVFDMQTIKRVLKALHIAYRDKQ